MANQLDFRVKNGLIVGGNANIAGALNVSGTVIATSFTGTLTGNATTLAIGRTIALTGDVTYTSGAFNGSANVTGAATLASVGTAGTYTKVTTDVKGRVTSGTTLAAADVPNLDAAKITSGTIDAARLPSYVDDVLEFANLTALPATGETGKIYVALDSNKAYRWSGSTYVFITSGAVDSVAGKTGVVTLISSDVGLGNVENKSSATIRSEISSSNVTTALGFTPYNSTNPAGYTSNTGTVTGVSGTAPIVSSGGAAPAISISAATVSAAGSMSAADKSKLDGIATGATNTGSVTNTNQLINGSGFITSESDTLTTVTGRGATTATAISLTNSTASTSTTTGALTVTGGVGIRGSLFIGAPDTGVLSALNSFVASGNGTTAVAVDPTGRFVYVTNNGTVSQFSINQTTGVPTSIASPIAAGIGGSYGVVVDSTGRFVYATNYSANTVSQYSINQTTGALTSITTDIASGQRPIGIATDPTGKFVYVTNQDVASVSQYSINQTTGALTSIAAAIFIAGSSVFPSGVAVDPTGRFVYVGTYVNNTVAQFSINQTTGALTSITTPIATGGSTFPTAVAVDPTGKFVYAVLEGNRTLAQFSINQTTGALTTITAAIATGNSPKEVSVDSTGRFVYVTNYADDTVSQYSINQTTGALTSIAAAILTGDGPIGVAVDPTGRFVFVVNQGGTARLNQHSISTGSLASLENLTVFGGVTGITPRKIGLGNVTNESKATMFASPTFTGNVGINQTTPLARLQVEELGIDTTTTTLAISTGITAVYTSATTAFRTLELMVQVTQGTSYHSVKLFVLHNGADVWFNQTNVLHTAAELGTFSMDITSGNVRLLYTPTSTAVASVIKVGAMKLAV